MHGLVRQVEEERLAGVPAGFQPVDRIVRQFIRDVPAPRRDLAVDIQRLHIASRHPQGRDAIGRKIRPLPLETDPSVKAGTRIVGRGAHVPLAEEARLVSRLLEIARKEHQPLLRRIVVVDDAVVHRRQPGQQRRATGRAQRCRDHGIGKVGPVAGEVVDVGCFKARRQEAHRIEAQIVEQHEHDVGTGRIVGRKWGLGRCRARRQSNRQCESPAPKSHSNPLASCAAPHRAACRLPGAA